MDQYNRPSLPRRLGYLFLQFQIEMIRKGTIVMPTAEKQVKTDFDDSAPAKADDQINSSIRCKPEAVA